MLQTAPVLLMFPPTVGPFARVDAEPARFDFTGYVKQANFVSMSGLSQIISLH